MEVVTCFLLKRSPKERDQILILRRSLQVRTYLGRWGGVSGYLEDAPLAQAYKEIAEETGLKEEELRFIRAGEPLPVDDPEGGHLWLVYPFLFEAIHPEKLRVDWEHTEACWVPPESLSQYETVPKLVEALARVYGGEKT